MIAITGATGLLGQHVIENLLQTVSAGQIVAIVRNPAKGASLSRKGISVRQADYNDEASLIRAYYLLQTESQQIFMENGFVSLS